MQQVNIKFLNLPEPGPEARFDGQAARAIALGARLGERGARGRASRPGASGRPDRTYRRLLAAIDAREVVEPRGRHPDLVSAHGVRSGARRRSSVRRSRVGDRSTSSSRFGMPCSVERPSMRRSISRPLSVRAAASSGNRGHRPKPSPPWNSAGIRLPVTATAVTGPAPVSRREGDTGEPGRRPKLVDGSARSEDFSPEELPRHPLVPLYVERHYGSVPNELAFVVVGFSRPRRCGGRSGRARKPGSADLGLDGENQRNGCYGGLGRTRERSRRMTPFARMTRFGRMETAGSGNDAPGGARCGLPGRSEGGTETG